MSLKKVVNCINKHKRFLITTHKNVEGDALGSEIALYKLLLKLGKSAVIINQDKLPAGYSFLPCSRLIKKYKNNLSSKFDVFIMVDCAGKSRCGSVIDMAGTGKPIINIDHHISNTKFGDVNWVLAESSSASEMIFRLYKAMKVDFDTDIAKALYVGILTDTGSFRYSNTTAFTHKAVAELMKFNVNVPQIYRQIYESISFSDIAMLSKMLATLENHASGKIIIFEITNKLLEGRRVNFDFTDYVLKFGRLIRGSQVCLLFREQLANSGAIRVNLRSKGKVDVNRVAQAFGGGGHKTASGCTIEGSLKSVKNKVIKKIQQQL